MKREVGKIGGLIRDTVHQLDGQADVILFGSRARGDARADSDWDILVLTENAVDDSMERVLRDRIYDVELETGEPMSLLVYSKGEWFGKQRVTPFFENVSEEGIRL